MGYTVPPEQRTSWAVESAIIIAYGIFFSSGVFNEEMIRKDLKEVICLEGNDKFQDVTFWTRLAKALWFWT